MVLEPLGSSGESMDTHHKVTKDGNLPTGIAAKLRHSVGAPFCAASECSLSTNSSDLDTTATPGQVKST